MNYYIFIYLFIIYYYKQVNAASNEIIEDNYCEASATKRNITR